MNKRPNTNPRGFTLLELMIGMAIFLIISGAVLTSMANLQANYRRAEMYTTMQQRLRATMELMAQEIGQAGLQGSTVEGGATGGDATFAAPFKFTNAITASASPQTVAITVASGSGVFTPYVGEWLMVDGGSNQEPVQISEIPPTVATGDIQGLFTNNHAASTQAYPMGVFPDGIVSAQSTATKLAMFGEINGTGNGLYAVEYTCPASGTTGSLTRTEWNLGPYPSALTATSYPLIDNVTLCYFCWPGGPGFSPNGTNLCPTTAAPANDSISLPNAVGGTDTYSIVTQIGFTITVSETATISGISQPISITKSYSNIQPRNLITAYNIYQAALTSATNANNGTTYTTYLKGELQPDPAAVSVGMVGLW
jgi:prepilin-type N-terminal cleavage/methylation domain-containing protein